MKINKIDHISIAVKDISTFGKIFSELFGISFGAEREVPDQKVKVVFGTFNGSKIELTAPASPDSPIAKFLEKRGDGLHHICLEVDNLEKCLQELKQKGVEPLGKISTGSYGKKIVFLDFKKTGGVLIELKEK
ncbi:MAG: hypothetical protein RBG1_1C00001G1467 [candidate division Zixibacteria bacterium RBG-1]|nr:MAG: hypothetical protein RBG1_1C00001G1467 [candidate division Zixibacteria bacterium RBG-1]OGC85171.1 MAG: methylmalonyl-CoA epimerase [candidate division Zixibacteria bacterium RBG_19FT_COMBO_42_43]